ncbi:hypothetical protein PGC35_20400 [Psychrobacillus sp. PGGUH221]|uniref:hypothetical protein n=1 Tax=Psychrobacillus sp. PGGUH221 TaxID=3020058 RepID=UPI0035C73E12
MSNLLNNNSKKKLLNRGPQITPTTEFKLDEVTPTSTITKVNENTNKIIKSDKKITSVRVRKSTQKQLNALVNLNKADSVDQLIEIMLDEYKSNNLLKEEKKQFDLIMDLLNSKDM